MEGVARAQLATRILYQQDIASARADAVLAALKGAPVLHHLDASEVLDVPLVGLASLVRIAASRSASTLFTSLLLYTVTLIQFCRFALMDQKPPVTLSFLKVFTLTTSRLRTSTKSLHRGTSSTGRWPSSGRAARDSRSSP